MNEERKVYCPECGDGRAAVEPARRDFFRLVCGHLAAVAGTAGLLTASRGARAADTAAKPRPAEDLVKELHAGLSAEQKTALVLPYDHGGGDGKLPTRAGMYNRPIQDKRIGQHYTKPQQELIDRILHAISSDEAGYRCITRNGTFDASRSLDGCGALLFGEPIDGKPWSWVFSGHHLTVRCDGRPTDGIGFGGPLYYGHSPNGYSDKNVFYYQTKSVLRVHDALDEKQRKVAVIDGSPGEQYPSVKLRDPNQPRPGIPLSDLSKDQQGLVEKVMRDLLSPYRKEDADEVMQVIKTTGGFEKLSLAFYKDDGMNDKQPWHFWRLEGPGLVWNFRVLPHVHTFVNIAAKG